MNKISSMHFVRDSQNYDVTYSDEDFCGFTRSPAPSCTFLSIRSKRSGKPEFHLLLLISHQCHRMTVKGIKRIQECNRLHRHPKMIHLISALVILPALATLTFTAAAPPPRSINCTDWRNIVDVYGARIFMLGDRGFHVPKNLIDMENKTCPRMIEAGDRIKGVLKTCLKPFPKTVAGMILRGTRKVTRENCNSSEEKAAIVRHLSCIKDGNKIDKLHEVMDKMNKQLCLIKRTVPVDKMIDACCCAYIARTNELESVTRSFCPPSSVNYAMKLVDRMFKEANDFICSQYQQDTRKCIAIEKAYPLNVTKDTRKENVSVLIPMLDVLTEIGTHPDD